MAHGGWRRFVFAFAAQLVLCRSGNHNSTRKISEFLLSNQTISNRTIKVKGFSK
jgi:hypothetical protein